MTESAYPRTSAVQEFPQIGVSNSEVGAFKCERAWLYGYHPTAKLAPKSFGVARTRGLVGHKVLEIFYLSIKEGNSYEVAVDNGMSYFESQRRTAFMEVDNGKLEMLNFLHKLLTLYFEYYRSDIENWEILDVESFHLLEWEGEDRVYLPMKLDLVIYQKSGKYAGEISPVDHKFTNDFWNEWQLRLNSQLPLYIRALRASRFEGKYEPVVKRSIVNQIRTRSVANPYPLETFHRSFIEANDFAMDKIFNNHLKKSLKIERLKRMQLTGAMEETSANWGTPDCKFCDFKSLCAIELEGGNVRTTIAAEYEKSTYGYPTMEELRSER